MTQVINTDFLCWIGNGYWDKENKICVRRGNTPKDSMSCRKEFGYWSETKKDCYYGPVSPGTQSPQDFQGTQITSGICSNSGGQMNKKNQCILSNVNASQCQAYGAKWEENECILKFPCKEGSMYLAYGYSSQLEGACCPTGQAYVTSLESNLTCCPKGTSVGEDLDDKLYCYKPEA